MKIAVLGIGTELTAGQILNRNACWISKQLQQMGVLTSCHLVVPDKKELILKALDFCAQESDILFVTGGLGPTTDDFTRYVIAEWVNKPLEYDENSYKHIESILAPRGIPIRDEQKNQCYFPLGSKIFTNLLGTANAFYTTKDKKPGELEIYVLPGPPREIESAWTNDIASVIQKQTVNLDPHITFSWDCIGLGESEIAHIAEKTVKAQPLEKGYRVHIPYVEVKMSLYRSQLTALQPTLDQLDQNLSPYTVTKNGEDIVALLAHKLEACKNIFVYDEVSKGYLLERLLPLSRKLWGEQKINFVTEKSLLENKNPEDLYLTLKNLGTETAEAQFDWHGKSLKKTLQSPYKLVSLQERSRQYFSESAFIFWLKSF